MNKKFLSVLVSTLFLLNTVEFAFADKKDVADPALQAIITELGSRMPRFINKYGASVFVADEQITRGSLLQALYEFDKKSSSSGASSAGVISKKDYDALTLKVASLEKKLQSSSGKSSSGGSADIVEIMNDLEVNLPTMLDNTLSSSKVFKNLEAQVKAGGSGTASGGGVSVAVVNNLQKNINDLSKKINSVEASVAKGTDSKASAAQAAEVAALKKSMSDLSAKFNSMETALTSAKSGSKSTTSAEVTYLQKNIDDLNKKINSMETNLAKNSGSKSDISASALKDVQKNVDDLNKKINSMETNLAKNSGSKSDISASALKDMQKNINDINSKINNVESSLASLGKDSSKVGSSANNAQVLYEVKNFKNEINTVNKKISEMESKLASAGRSSSVSNGPSQDEVNSLKKTLVQMQQSYVTLGKRLDSIEKDQNAYASLAKGSDSGKSLSSSQMKIINEKISSIREEVDNIKVESSSAASNSKNTADIKKIEKRLSNLENSERSSGKSSSSSDSGSSGKGGTIAKVSLGLSLVAALFIAR
jgi:chromosome segregation ATPase